MKLVEAARTEYEQYGVVSEKTVMALIAKVEEQERLLILQKAADSWSNFKPGDVK